MNAITPTPSSLVAIIDALHSQHIRPSADAWVTALREARANPADPDRATLALILAAKRLEGDGKHAAAVLRRELTASMEQDGVTGFDGPNHTASRRPASRLVQITDAKALAAAHPELMLPQEPVPDKKEIGRRLRAKETIAGAVLSNGGAPVLTISAKKA